MNSPFITDFLLQQITSKFNNPIIRNQKTRNNDINSRVDSVQIFDEMDNYYNLTASLFKDRSILPISKINGVKNNEILEKKVYVITRQENISDLQKSKQKSKIINRIINNNKGKIEPQNNTADTFLTLYPYYRLTTDYKTFIQRLEWFSKYHNIEKEQPEKFFKHTTKEYTHFERLMNRIDDFIQVREPTEKIYKSPYFSEKAYEKYLKEQKKSYDDKKSDIETSQLNSFEESEKQEKINGSGFSQFYVKRLKKIDLMLQNDIPIWNKLRLQLITKYLDIKRNFASTTYFRDQSLRDYDINDYSFAKQFTLVRAGAETHFLNKFSDKTLEGFKSIIPIFLNPKDAEEFLESTLESQVQYYERLPIGSGKLLDQLRKFKREKFEANRKLKNQFLSDLEKIQIKEILLTDILDFSVALSNDYEETNRFEFLVIPDLEKISSQTNWKKFGIKTLKEDSFNDYINATWPNTLTFDENLAEQVLTNEIILNRGKNLYSSKSIESL